MHDSTATASRPGTGNTPAPAALRKSLKNRHVQLIALGGAIGTGLFYGSSESIALAGPSILLAYLVGGLAIFMIVRALGEMSVEDPRAGAFSYYATRYWSKRAGFVSGWNYWFNYILVSMVELSVVGSFVNYWFPAIPQWVSAAVFLVVIAAMNLLGVSKFGEFEFWFAIIKIVAVIAMIVSGLAVLIAGLPTDSGVKASFSNWFALDGGVLPHGLLQQSADGQWTGLLMRLVVVMFSFGGTSSSASRPARPKIHAVPFPARRMASSGASWCFTSAHWRDHGRGAVEHDRRHDQPVRADLRLGGRARGRRHPQVPCADCGDERVQLRPVRQLPHVGNSLARQGNAPEILGKLNFHGVPVVGALASAAITALAVVVVFLWPDFAFNYLMSIATIAGVINWSMIYVTEIHFRRRVAAGKTGPASWPGSPETRLWDASISSCRSPADAYVVLAFLAFVVVLMCFSSSYRVAVIAGVVWLAILLTAYQVTQTRKTVRP